MKEESLEELVQHLAEIIVSIDRDVADLRASIAALTTVVAGQINPGNYAEGIRRIRRLETAARAADPTAETLKELNDVVNAIRLIHKHGSHES